jgi:hypothetical protein
MLVVAVCTSTPGAWTTHAHATPLPAMDREPTTVLVAAPGIDPGSKPKRQRRRVADRTRRVRRA